MSWRALVLGAFALASAFAHVGRADAHAVSSNYLVMHAERAGDIDARWDLAVSDINWALALDTNEDRRITWGEIAGRRTDIEALATAGLRLTRAGAACPLSLADLSLTEHAAEPHVALHLRAHCASGGQLAISSTLFASEDASQKTLIDLTTSGGQFTSVIAATGEAWLEPAHSSWFATFVSFIGQGLTHVWTGYDHVAFLLLLLLPSVLRQSEGKWQAASSTRQIFRDLLTIVTAFTLAHSITLALAATGTVRPPVRLVESAIALSIVAAGILNLFPRGARWRLPIAFGFGLMHGFGFANALAELGAKGARLVPALAGFNIGVELAQLSIVIVLLPILLRVRAAPLYAARVMPWASAATAVAGAAWLVQRVS